MKIDIFVFKTPNVRIRENYERLNTNLLLIWHFTVFQLIIRGLHFFFISLFQFIKPMNFKIRLKDAVCADIIIAITNVNFLN